MWHALHCYLVHDIVLNFDDVGNLRTTKSIQKVMKSEASLAGYSYTTYPAEKLVMGGAAGFFVELVHDHAVRPRKSLSSCLLSTILQV